MLLEAEEEEENNEEDAREYSTIEEKQERLGEESLDIPVVKTALIQQRPERNGEGNIELHKWKQFNSHKRTVVAIYATHLMGWQPDSTKQAKVRNSLAYTLASYDLGFEKVVGKYSLETLLNKMEESVSYNNARQTMREKRR